MNDRSDISVTGPAAAYAQLGMYNGHVQGSLGSPYVPPSTVVGSYIVPCYAPITYDSLTHSMAPSYAGYFNITDAYGKSANNCSTRFISRLCNGDVNCGGSMPTPMPSMMPSRMPTSNGFHY